VCIVLGSSIWCHQSTGVYCVRQQHLVPPERWCVLC